MNSFWRKRSFFFCLFLQGLSIFDICRYWTFPWIPFWLTMLYNFRFRSKARLFVMKTYCSYIVMCKHNVIFSAWLTFFFPISYFYHASPSVADSLLPSSRRQICILGLKVSLLLHQNLSFLFSFGDSYQNESYNEVYQKLIKFELNFQCD